MTVWATRADQVDLRGPNPHDLARSLDVPGVDVGLSAGGQDEAALGEPSKEGRGVLDLLAGMAATGWGDRFLLSAGAQVRQDFPGGEAAHELDVVRVGDVGEVADQPSFERADPV